MTAALWPPEAEESLTLRFQPPVDVHQRSRARARTVKPTAYPSVIKALEVVKLVQPKGEDVAKQVLIRRPNELCEVLL